jgi:ankyrin repeat protein
VYELLQKKADVNAMSISGEYPLLLAAERKHSKLIQFLLQNGAKHTEQKTQNEGNSVLHISCL